MQSPLNICVYNVYIYIYIYIYVYNMYIYIIFTSCNHHDFLRIAIAISYIPIQLVTSPEYSSWLIVSILLSSDG